MSNAELKPIVGQRAAVDVFMPSIDNRNLGDYVKELKIKAFINNGYAIRIQLKNPNFAILDALFEGGAGNKKFMSQVRSNPVPVKVKIRYEPGPQGYPKAATRDIFGYITTVYPHGQAEIDYTEFIAIDPLNYYLRIGDAYGGAFEGNVSQVIRKVINRYMPDAQITIPDTNDSKNNVWWMMRRSPRDMLSHLIHLASSLDDSRTPWVIGVHNNEVKVGPLSTFQPRELGYYRKMDENGNGDMLRWEAILNPSLGHHEMGLVTAGVTATLGQVYDQTNRPKEAIITDSNTGGKYVPYQPKSGALRSTIRPEKETFKKGRFGRSFVDSPPEYYSGGEIDFPYLKYFDAYARTEYMRGVYKLFTMDLTIKGHGIWDSTIGMGADNVYVDWRNNFKDGSRSYFLAGNWLVYGFEHTWHENNWTTKMQLSKMDLNAKGQEVGQKPRN